MRSHDLGGPEDRWRVSDFALGVRVLLVTAQLHWGSSGFSTALPLLLQALALAQQHHLQALASETILHLTFTQVSPRLRTEE